MDLNELEQRYEQRDSSNGAPILEWLVVSLAVLEMVAVTLAAWWLWTI